MRLGCAEICGDFLEDLHQNRQAPGVAELDFEVAGTPLGGPGREPALDLDPRGPAKQERIAREHCDQQQRRTDRDRPEHRHRDGSHPQRHPERDGGEEAPVGCDGAHLGTATLRSVWLSASSGVRPSTSAAGSSWILCRRAGRSIAWTSSGST